MKIVFLGPPGAGKGTQAQKIIDHLSIVQISTGDMLRQAVAAGTNLGKSAERYMKSGDLVPDEVIIGLVKERVSKPDCANGFLLDGFPRTIAQAEAMQQEGILVDMVIEIMVPDEELVRRLSGRRVHKSSGRTYHTIFNPPKVEGKDDVTGEALIQRPDDQKETVLERLKVYHKMTKPLTSFYQTLARQKECRYEVVNGTGDMATIEKNILQALGA